MALQGLVFVPHAHTKFQKRCVLAWRFSMSVLVQRRSTVTVRRVSPTKGLSVTESLPPRHDGKRGVSFEILFVFSVLSLLFCLCGTRCLAHPAQVVVFFFYASRVPKKAGWEAASRMRTQRPDRGGFFLSLGSGLRGTGDQIGNFGLLLTGGGHAYGCDS